MPKKLSDILEKCDDCPYKYGCEHTQKELKGINLMLETTDIKHKRICPIIVVDADDKTESTD